MSDTAESMEEFDELIRILEQWDESNRPDFLTTTSSLPDNQFSFPARPVLFLGGTHSYYLRLTCGRHLFLTASTAGGPASYPLQPDEVFFTGQAVSLSGRCFIRSPTFQPTVP